MIHGQVQSKIIQINEEQEASHQKWFMWKHGKKLTNNYSPTQRYLLRIIRIMRYYYWFIKNVMIKHILS